MRGGLTVLPIGVTQFGQGVALIERRQVGHQGPVAHRVGGLHVQIDVQPRPLAGEQRQREFEHCTVELLVRFGIADGGEPLVDAIAVQVAKILHGDREILVFVWRSDSLRAVGQELHSQHRVTQGEPRGRRAESVRVGRTAVEFDVEMPGHAAELLVVVAAHPHSVLHWSQRKRLAGCVGAIGLRGRLIDRLVGSGGVRAGGYKF